MKSQTLSCFRVRSLLNMTVVNISFRISIPPNSSEHVCLMCPVPRFGGNTQTHSLLVCRGIEAGNQYLPHTRYTHTHTHSRLDGTEPTNGHTSTLLCVGCWLLLRYTESESDRCIFPLALLLLGVCVCVRCAARRGKIFAVCHVLFYMY